MDELDRLVKELLERHKGGSVFFDHLDEALISNEPVINAFIEMLPEDVGLIGSGRFGRFFANYFPQRRPDDGRRIISVNGGLRGGEEIDDLSYLQLDGLGLVFVDDSYYSGKTRNRVWMEVERNGGLLLATYVIYDGSRHRDESVHSQYRYYDMSQRDA